MSLERTLRRQLQRQRQGDKMVVLEKLPPGIVLAVVQDGPTSLKLQTQMGAPQALQILGSLCESLRVQAAVEAIKAEQRVQLASADQVPAEPNTHTGTPRLT